MMRISRQRNGQRLVHRPNVRVQQIAPLRAIFSGGRV